MPVSVKVGGVWKTAAAVYNKVGGVWKTAADMPVKVGGVWKTGILASGAYEPIATITGNGSSGTITFSSIPSTYASLQIRFNAWTNNYDSLYMRFNGNTGANYAYHRVRGGGVTPTTENGINQTGISLTTGQTLSQGNDVLFGGVIDVHDYASSTKNTTIRAITGKDLNTSGIIAIGSGLWNSTSTVTSITFYVDGGGQFQSPSVFSLYGIKGA